MTPPKIAIVGMAGRFPGARNVQAFWQNLRDGVESIRTLSEQELLAAGVTREELDRPDYVRRAALLDDVPMFDAAFFGMSPRDAAIMDPQHRHFLQCVWHALEDAAHPPHAFTGSIGVFAGSGLNSYLIHNLLANRKLVAEAGLFQLKQTGNDKDVLTTRASYQFDLRGPSINVQTACSTSLVAVHLACQSLLNQECDMALAGGVTIEIPHGLGYVYREGEILSRDGRCRPFDAASTGTVFASGAGVVVLRRLEDALADGDPIRAVIAGSAINNDGARKAGYLAPSVEGQAEVIAEALAFAGVTAEAISYVEAHGTGTLVGDPIEVRALTQAFRKSTQRAGYCGIGSLKSNVGHLDAAAGVASLIKTVLALEHEQLPPSLHFVRPNPHLELEGSPFFVNHTLRDWPRGHVPRRAGVTSLGIGGTNAHVVVEEAPALSASRTSRHCYLFTVSAKTQAALARSFDNLAAHLDAHPEIDLADASWTSQAGRQAFAHRRAFVVEDTHAEGRTISQIAAAHNVAGHAAHTPPHVAFLFSGQGAQSIDMGRALYEHELVFREALDRCAQVLLEPLGLDLRTVLYPSVQDEAAAAEKLHETWLTQPALFAVEYALAQWWRSIGIEPAALAGHSIGEYVAACIAGVFTLEDALELVAARGRLMHAMPRGAMMAVALGADGLHLGGSMSLAAINGPAQCVVSGPAAEIDALRQDLALQSVACRKLATSHAFHSAMMDPVLAAFEQQVRRVRLHAPRIPFLSNLTGTWIMPEQATDAGYWVSQLRHTVRFSECVAELLRIPDQVLIEVGPGDTLASLARQQGGSAVRAFASLPRTHEARSALGSVLETVGQLWTLGAEIDWRRLHVAGSVRRVPLPTYPFEQQRFWIEPDRVLPPVLIERAGSFDSTAPPNLGGLFLYRRVWKRVERIQDTRTLAPLAAGECWMIFSDELGLGEAAAGSLRASGHEVIVVSAALSYKQHDAWSYALRPGERGDYDALMMSVLAGGRQPEKILHLWPLLGEEHNLTLAEVVDRCFNSPLLLAQALGGHEDLRVEMVMVSNGMQQVHGELVRDPERAVLLGPVRATPLELPHIACRSIDVELDVAEPAKCAKKLIEEALAPHESATVALRSGEFYIETLEPLTLPSGQRSDGIVRGGVYLITGGLGGVGLVIAEHLAREFEVRLVLVGRSAVPASDAARVDALRMAAGGLLLAQADVTDLEQMRGVVVLTLKTFGKIDGVLHAAGVLDDGPLLLKTRESAARVLAPKVHGTLVLEQALAGVPLRSFALFSSISSIDPPAGQIDYAAANAFLDAFALSRGAPYTVINWGLWRGVGMGRTHEPKHAAHALLGACLLDGPDAVVYETHLSGETHWVLEDHKVKGEHGARALLPGTAYMEMARAAFEQVRGRNAANGAVELRDVFFLAPLTVDAGESREVRIELRLEGGAADAFRFTVFSRKAEWLEHCTGRIAPCLAAAPAPVDGAALLARCSRGAVVFNNQQHTQQERHLEFGPRWRSLRRVTLGHQEAVAQLELDAGLLADLHTWPMHPALLDLATGAAFYLTNDYAACDDLFLPIAYKKLRLYGPLPARLFSHIRARSGIAERNQVESFDLTLFDEQDNVLAEIESFSARRISSDVQRHSASGGGEQPMELGQPRGIQAEQGVRALVRILGAGTPHAVIAVSEPLEKSVRHSDRKQAPEAGSDAAPAASVQNNETLEQTLARWWREMLGVAEVREDDDFFDLGGHSLIAVRLLTRVKKTYGVDLDFSLLFEERTVRKLAAAIRGSRQIL